MNAKRYTIKEAAAALNLSEVYIRRMISQKKLNTVQIRISENVWRHEIEEEEIKRWRSASASRTTRSDNRNKFNLYATGDELAILETFIRNNNLGIIVERANKPEDIKRRYAARKAKAKA